MPLDPAVAAPIAAPNLRSRNLAHRRGRPDARGDRVLRPVGSHVKREVRTGGRRQPVVVAAAAGIVRLDIKRERAVLAKLEAPVLRAQRVARERVGLEEMMLVVKC